MCAGAGADVVVDGLGDAGEGGERVMVLWRLWVGKSMLMLGLVRMLVLMWVVVCVRQRHKACAGS